ncbi:MAG: hypothetical protein ACO3NK_14215 [Prochlorotrichaceae cyanobacterium]|jgi:hypothetical protein
MIFKKKKEQFFLTLDEGSQAPDAAPQVVEAPKTTPEAPPAPKASKAKAPKAKASTATTPAPDPSEIIAAAVKAAPAPVVKAAPAPSVVPYEFFPGRRRPGPSLQGFMEMARNMGRS